MKIVLAKNALAGPLKELAKVINPKSIFPILENFLFEVKDGKVKVTTSDNETTMTTELQVVECEGEGAICIPAKSFIDGVSNVPEQPVTVIIEGLEVVVNYQNGQFAMTGCNADEYPKVADVVGKEITISGKDLAGGINATLYGSANDELRPVLNGVYLDMRGEYLYFVSTDGTRLIATKKNATVGDMDSFVLAKKPATLIRAFAEKETDVNIVSDGRNARFSGGGFNLICRLVDGRFPQWEKVIPVDNPLKMEANRQAFLNAVKRVSVFAAVTGLIRLDIKDGELKIQAENIDFAVSARETMFCQFNGEIAIGFKASHLMDMLSYLSGETISLNLSEPSKAGLVVSDDVRMVLMPMVL